MKNLKFKIIHLLIFFIWIYIVVFLLPFFIINFLAIFFPFVSFFDKLSYQIPLFETLLYLTFILPGIGLLLQRSVKQLPKYSPWHLPHSTQGFFIITALVISYLLWTNNSWLLKLSIVSFVVLFIFFLWYIPYVHYFIRSIELSDLQDFFHSPKIEIKGIKELNKWDVLSLSKKIIIGIFLLSSLHFTVIQIDEKIIKKYNKQQHRLSFNARIESIQPTLVYPATKVVIKGEKFDWNSNIPVKLMSNYGEINTDLWTDGKIIFTIPLNWKPRIITLWIEKPISLDNKDHISKSNTVSLELIPISTNFTEKDNQYFEQREYWDDETLEINGYPPREKGNLIHEFIRTIQLKFKQKQP